MTGGSRARWRCLLAAAATILLAGTVPAHNLDQRDTSIAFDDAYLQLMLTRADLEETLIQDDDEFWMILRSTPGPGTQTGVGGYLTFYVPTNYVEVLEVSYLTPSPGTAGTPEAPTNFTRVPLKGQSIIAIGNGSIAPSITTNLIGLVLTNAFGQAEAPVTSNGLHRGTIAGVYADTGIFYSRDPRTEWQSWAAAPPTGPLSRRGYPVDLVNNRGETVTPITRYDAEQLIAYGRKDVDPVVDPNGRGSTPWGLGNVVAGPESGYAWQFDLNTWLDTTNMQLAVSGVGPWERIRYPGSQYARDEAGLISSALGYAGVNASELGFALGVDPGEAPLPGDANAVRISYGMLELGRPEYAGIRIRVRNPPAAECFTISTDAFGGDAGGEQNGKDHEWRYYDPTIVTINPCTLLIKTPSEPLVRPGDTLYFTLTFINNGLAAYTNVVLTDVLPTGLSFVSAVPPQDSGPNPLVWSLGPVGVNEMRQVRVYVQPAAAGTFRNIVVARQGTNVLAEAEGVVDASYKSLLRGDKTVVPEAVGAGGSVTYTLTVYNDGTGANTVPLVINELLPSGFAYAGMVAQEINGAPLLPTALTVDASNPNRPSFRVGTGINAGETLVLRFLAQVDPAEPAGVYCNTLTLTYENKIINVPQQACVTVGGGRIGDGVFRDWNGNGVQDTGEEGLPGVTMNLYTGACPAVGTPVKTAVSDAAGTYLFSGLNAGSYCVKADTNSAPAGYSLTTANPVGVTLTQDQVFVEADFGFRPAGAGVLDGRVFDDANGNGVFGGAEAGIAGVLVRLYEDSNGDGAPAAGDVLVAATNSGAGGAYVFSNLALNVSYLVDADEADTDLITHFSPNAFLATTPALRAVSNLAGAVSGADFGYRADLPGRIGDSVFLDVNGNGTNDAADLPLPGVTVTLYRGDGGDQPLATAVSDGAGYYLFDGLAPDTYLVVVDTEDPDVPAGVSVAVPQYLVTLASGASVLTADFAFRRLIAKTVDKAFATTNEVLTYTLTAGFSGSDPVNGATILDPFPAGVTFSNATAGGVYGVYVPQAAVPGVEQAEVTDLVITNPVADTYLQQDGAAANTPQDSGNRIKVKTETGKQRIGLMRFDLSGIPEGKTILSASLMYSVQNAGTFNTMDAYRMLTDWTEAGATWNTNGIAGSDWAGGSFGAADFDPTPYGPMSVTPVGWKTNDVTELLKTWVEDGAANYGMALMGAISANTDEAQIYDREDAGAGLGPRLAVSYAAAGEITTTNTLSLSRSVMATGQPVTISMKLWASQAISNVTPSLSVNSGQAVITGPVETSPTNVPAGTPVTFTFVCVPYSIGELVFVGSAESEDGFTFVDSRSASVLVSPNGSSNVVTWSLGTNTDSQGGAVASDGTAPSLYAFQGKTRAFWQYSILSNAWAVKAQVAANTDQGAGLAYDGANTIYGTRGGSGTGGTKTFWAYSISNNTWTTLANTPQNIKWGGALAYLGGYVYGFRGDDKTDFWRYDPVSNAWSILASAPGTVKEGGALGTDGTALYALRGDGSAMFWKYVVASNAWTSLANAPGNVKKGGALTYLGGYFYAFRGDNKKDFWRYSVASNSWTKLTSLSEAVLGGGALASDSTYVYGFSGNAKKFVWRYNPATGAWTKMRDAPGNVGDGGALVFVKGTAASLRQVSIETDRTLVQSGTVVTVTMEALSSAHETNVAPTALTVVATNGAGAVLLSGPTPTQVAGLASNQAAEFAWTYRVYSGTNIGRVYFRGGATNGAGQSFGTASSGDIIVVPPLIFRARVSSPITVPWVENTAIIGDLSGAIPQTLSETVRTALSASIGDRVWLDLNADGLQNAGEPGIPNVTAWLYQDPNNNGQIDAGETQRVATATDLAGAYHFYNIAPGTNYTVTYDYSTVPAGYLPTTASNTNSPSKTVHDVGVITPGLQYTNADFGLSPPGAARLGDTAWWDADRNGARDAGEGGLTNVTVLLYLDANLNGLLDGADFFLQSVTTDTNGNYQFTGLTTNAYLVAVDGASLVGSPYGGAAAISNAMTLTGGASPHAVTLATTNEAYADADFGYDWRGTIGDYVWWDDNRNGVPDGGELPVTNAQVLLYVDTNGDGRLDPLDGHYQVAEAFVGADGYYYFHHLPPGPYLVDLYEDSLRADEVVPTTPDVHFIVLGGGETNLTADFGYFEGALVAGYIFRDENRNSLIDPGEAGLAGGSVHLVGADLYGNPVSLTNVTDAVGRYAFVVAEGDYTVSYDYSGLVASYPLLREPTTATNYLFHAFPGEEWASRFDFGVDHGGRVGGLVFADLDGDGAQDPGEPGLAGVWVILYDAATNALELAVTDGSGRYEYVGLGDGAYQVQVQTNALPPGFLGIPTADPTPPLDGWGHTNVLDGGAVSAMDFGYPPAPGRTFYAVSGTIYYDAATNGLFDGGDTGLAGLTVRVAVDTNADAAADASYVLITDSNGLYRLGGIPSNSAVTIAVDESTLPDAAHHLAGDPDGAPLTNSWTIAALHDDAEGLDFGYIATYGSVSGTVCDGDGNGLYDEGMDTPLAEVGITLRYAGRDGILHTPDDTVRVTQTALDGTYSFDGLPPGFYSITEDSVAAYAYLDLADADGGNPNVILVHLGLGEDKTQQDFEDTHWIGRAGLTYNASTMSSNEFIWVDKPDEQRAENTNSANAGIRELRMYANDSNFYVRVKMNDIVLAQNAYVAIGLDTRRAAGSGALSWLGDDSGLSIGGDYFGGPPPVHYPVRNIVVHEVDGRARAEIFDYDGYDWHEPPSGWSAAIISTVSDALELRIPRADLLLGGSVTARFTVASFLNAGSWANEGDSTTVAYPGTPDAVDSVSIAPWQVNDGQLDVTAWHEDISDFDVDFWVDVRFDASGLAGHAPPSMPQVVSPADDEALSEPPNLIWEASTDSDGEVTGYLLEVGTDSALNGADGTENGKIALRVNLPATQTNYAFSTSATQYWWRVRARDTAGALSDGTIQSFRLGGKSDFGGPVPTLLYVGTNVSGFMAGDYDAWIALYGPIQSITDAELTQPLNHLGFAIRWTDPNGVYATNRMSADAGADQGRFTWNIVPADGRVSPNWSALWTNPATGDRQDLASDRVFWGSNVAAVGNSSPVLTSWVFNAFTITNFNEDQEYYLMLSAEDDYHGNGTWWPYGSWASHGGPNPPAWGGYAEDGPNSFRNVTTNYPIRITARDDDPLPPTAARGQNWANLRSMLASNSTALLQASGAGQAVIYRETDAALLSGSLSLFFNAHDYYSGIQVGPDGPALTNTVLSIGFGPRFAADFSHFDPARSAVADTTLDTSVLAWHWGALTTNDVTDLWGPDMYNAAGAVQPVRLTLWDRDSDRPNDQAVASNVVFGYLQVLDDDTEGPTAPSGVAVSPAGWTNQNSFQVSFDAATDPSGILEYRHGPAGQPPSSATSGAHANLPLVLSSVEGVTTNWLAAVDADNDRAGDGRMGAATSFVMRLDQTPPPKINGLQADEGEDPTSEARLHWAAAPNAGNRAGDNAPLSPWSTYRIYFTDDDSPVTAGSPYLDKDNGQPQLAAMGSGILNATLSNLVFGLTYRFRIVGRDAAGNEGPLSDEVEIVLPGFVVTQGQIHATSGDIRYSEVYWRAATNAYGGVSREYDLLWTDGPGFADSMSNQWKFLQGGYTNSLMDTGSQARTPPTLLTANMRFYRAASKDRWRTNRLPRVASEEVYGLRAVQVHAGQNWVALPVIPDSNTLGRVLGHDLPSGSQYTDPDTTVVSWYSRTSNEVVKKDVWLLDWGVSNQWRTGIGWGGINQPAEHFPVPYDEGLSVNIPTNQAPAYLLMFIGRVPTNAQTQVIEPNGAYNLVNMRLPCTLGLAQMNLLESGFKGGAVSTSSDRLRKLNRAMQSVGMDVYYNTTRQRWEYVNNSSAANFFISPDDAFLIWTRKSTTPWILTNAPPYTAPTRLMNP